MGSESTTTGISTRPNTLEEIKEAEKQRLREMTAQSTRNINLDRSGHSNGETTKTITQRILNRRNSAQDIAELRRAFANRIEAESTITGISTRPNTLEEIKEVEKQRL